MSVPSRQTSECYRRLITTGLGARIVYSIGICSMAMPAGEIGIGAIVRDGDDARSVCKCQGCSKSLRSG